MQQFNYYTIEPPAALRGHVRSFWVFEGNSLHGEPYIYRSMADPCAEMVFHYKGLWSGINEDNVFIPGTDTLTTLQSPTGTYKRFITGGDFGIFGAYLYPYAIPELFKLSSAELNNEMPAISDAIGVEGRRLELQILGAPDNKTRTAILSAWLIEKTKTIAPQFSSINDCVRHLINSRGPVNINKTAAQFCVSPRQLERKFKTITGFSPKSFARISRFQHSLKSYGSDFKSLTDIAYDCGYYDQSHFIHDFKEFSGYEPGKYFAGKAEGIEYRDC